MTTTENSRDALTDEQIINIAEKHHASHPGVDEWWAFRDRADVIAFGRAILAAAPVEKPAAAPIPTDDLEQMTPNQRRALNKGLAALETMADLWAVETRLTDMSERIAAVADEVERAKRIAAMIPSDSSKARTGTSSTTRILRPHPHPRQRTSGRRSM